MKNLKVEWCLYILNAYFEDCFDWLSKGEEREREKTWLNADCNGYIELKKKIVYENLWITKCRCLQRMDTIEPCAGFRFENTCST